MQLLVRDRVPLQTVANRCGIHRSTVYRWRLKWDTSNQHIQMDNPNRPHRTYSRAHHFALDDVADTNSFIASSRSCMGNS